jgi:copper transport protein
MRSNLRVETALVVAVLAASAALVGYPPPESVQSGPVSGNTLVGSDRLDYTVDPARVGPNEIHLYLFDDETGAPVDVNSMEAAFSLPESGIPPIDAELRKAGPGHYTAPSAMLAVPGGWRAEVTVRLSRFDQLSTTFEVPVE